MVLEKVIDNGFVLWYSRALSLVVVRDGFERYLKMQIFDYRLKNVKCVQNMEIRK